MFKHIAASFKKNFSTFIHNISRWFDIFMVSYSDEKYNSQVLGEGIQTKTAKNLLFSVTFCCFGLLIGWWESNDSRRISPKAKRGQYRWMTTDNCFEHDESPEEKAFRGFFWDFCWIWTAYFLSYGHQLSYIKGSGSTPLENPDTVNWRLKTENLKMNNTKRKSCRLHRQDFRFVNRVRKRYFSPALVGLELLQKNKSKNSCLYNFS